MAASALSDIAIVMFSTDMPLRIEFNLASGGKIVYFLAPRMEND